MKEKREKSISLLDIVEEIICESLDGSELPGSIKSKVHTQHLFTQLIFDRIIEKIKQGENVRINRFGGFSSRVIPEETRNPKNNATRNAKNRRRLRFKPSDLTIKRLN